MESKPLSFSIENILAWPIRDRTKDEVLIKHEDTARNSVEDYETTEERVSKCDQTTNVTSGNTTSDYTLDIDALVKELKTLEKAKEKQTKPTRYKLSGKQRDRLEEIFMRKQYVGPSERMRYSVELGLTDTQIRTWFQNRRARLRSRKNFQDGEIAISKAWGTERHFESQFQHKSITPECTWNEMDERMSTRNLRERNETSVNILHPLTKRRDTRTASSSFEKSRPYKCIPYYVKVYR